MHRPTVPGGLAVRIEGFYEPRYKHSHPAGWSSERMARVARYIDDCCGLETDVTARAACASRAAEQCATELAAERFLLEADHQHANESLLDALEKISGKNVLQLRSPVRDIFEARVYESDPTRGIVITWTAEHLEEMHQDIDRWCSGQPDPKLRAEQMEGIVEHHARDIARKHGLSTLPI
jgi:hypothetical protein